MKNIIIDEENTTVKLVEINPTEDIIFYTNNGVDEMLKIGGDGSFYVKGNKVAEDIEVYNAFVEFLKDAGHYQG